MAVRKHTYRRRARYDATPRTPDQEKVSIYANRPRPAAVLVMGEDGRFTQAVGSALVYPDRVEIVLLTPTGAAALAPACRRCGGEGKIALSDLLGLSPQELAEGYCQADVLAERVPCPQCAEW